MSINNEYLFNEFIKYHIPVFKIMDKKDSYVFCIDMICSNCNIQDSCSINKHEIIVPSLSKEQYEKIIKEHPEYRI